MKESRINWIIDAVAFAGFVIMFFLNLTGVALHQWLGAAVGVLALYHLFAHWEWVEAVSKRFFARTSNQARLYYLVDAGLLFSLAAILFSGLVISTWFSLPLENAAAWAVMHATVSELTLLLLVFKIAIHWRWIIRTARRWVSSPDVLLLGRSVGQKLVAPGSLDRRDFLKLMGVVGVASAAALINVTGPAEGVSAQPADFQAGSSAITQSAAACQLRCRKGRSCIYPGECHDYRDTNGNGRCDNGECA